MNIIFTHLTMIAHLTNTTNITHITNITAVWGLALGSYKNNTSEHGKTCFLEIGMYQRRSFGGGRNSALAPRLRGAKKSCF